MRLYFSDHGNRGSNWRKCCLMALMPLRFLLMIVTTGLCSCSKPEETRATIYVYAAASLSDAINELAEQFETESSAEVALNFASSGSLAQQIMATQQADIFLSANNRWMDEVEHAGLIVNGSRCDLLSNQLVIIASPNTDITLDAPGDLTAIDFQYLVIGDPEFVPAGQYAKQWLEQTRTPGGEALWPAVEGRISPMPDFRAALIQVRGQERLVGIVYLTDYLTAENDLTLLAKIPIEQTPPIRYSVAQIKHGDTNATADFIAYLRSPQARAIFERYGFTHLDGNEWNQ